MTRRRITLRNRACSTIPKQPQSKLGAVFSWLVVTYGQFRRTQAMLHPPGEWP